MMLGDILASARSSATDLQRWLRAVDPDLSAQMAERAEREGMSSTAYARVAVADFAARASEEDWATLTSSLRHSDDPGAACLVAMIHWKLTAPDCGRHTTIGVASQERTIR